MSENIRSSINSSSSPRRLQTISRPDWPWAARTYSQRGLQSSSQSTSSLPLPGSALQTGWEHRPSFASTTMASPSGNITWRSLASAAQRATPSSTASASFPQGESTRQWTFMGFEWAVKDIAKLKDYVEGVTQTEDQAQMTADDFEVLKQSPMIGDNKFKLEIAITPPNEESAARPILSLYITSLTMDYAHGDFETSATMMAAIKCQDDLVGERGARPEWVWEFWHHDWVFRQESEVWECHLPPLTDLLENQRILETDSLVICVQIHCPAGPSIPQQPSVYYVPRDLLDGLEASLDNPNTGDVRFICLERLSSEGSPRLGSSISSLGLESSSTSSSSSHFPFSLHTTARKRIIYAHSDILIRRSEYFATMLSSAFSENASLPLGERKVYTIVVEEADFETIYWLLKFCYANWILFKQHDDPRAAVEGVGAGWSAKWLNPRENEWDWKTFHKLGSGDESINDTRSATSGDSITPGGTLSRPGSGKSDGYQASIIPTSAAHVTAGTTRTNPNKTSLSTVASTSRQVHSTPRRLPTTGTSTTNAVNINVGGPSTATTRSKPISIPIAPNYAATPHYPVSPRAPRQPPPSTPDPHPHPCPPPPPASALSMYQVAHRYAMPGLANLALEHMILTITPGSCFALLLATYTWDELHSLVEDYVIEKWDEVSNTSEFECCCKEVANGEWGPDGGKTLMAVFRRLRSPVTGNS